MGKPDEIIIKKTLYERFMGRYSVFDLVVMPFMAAAGIAVKPIVAPLAHMLTGPLMIPGGAVAGGFYMIWLVLGAGIVRKSGAATIIAFLQALMIAVLGFFGSHGLFSIVSYTLPGIAIDCVLLVSRHRVCCPSCAFMAGAAANITGTICVAFIFFNLPLVPMAICLLAAVLFGGAGGLVAYGILKRLYKMGILQGESDGH